MQKAHPQMSLVLFTLASGPSDYAEDKRDDGDYQENMNNSAGIIDEETQDPSYN